MLAPILLAALLAASAPGRAGDLLIETAVPVEVSIGNTPLATTWGAARLRIRGLDPGLAGLRVVRGDRTDVLDVVVPDEGAAALVVQANGISTRPVEEAEAPPVVELRAALGQRFAVVLDGVRVATVGSQHPLRLEGISPGPHTLELRTVDLTVVWTRGDLDLQADDVVVITGQEGYAPLVSGRPQAFQLAGAAASTPVPPAAGPSPAGFSPAGG